MHAVGGIAPATKEAQHYARTSGCINLSAFHAREEILARILRCPHGSKPCCAELPVGIEPSHTRVWGADARLGIGELAEEVVLFSSGKRGVVVGTANHAKSIGIGAGGLFKRQAAF